MGFDSEKIIKDVVIYTDGAAEPNPGPGGYGVVLLYGNHRKEMSGGFARTTNNRMELLGVIAGLEALRSKCAVTVYSDSKYVVDAVNEGWIVRWQQNDWYRNRKREVKNIDLWERFLEIHEKHEVELVWVKGHAGVEENEVCDQLAVEATKGVDLKEDTGYIDVEKDSAVKRISISSTRDFAKTKKITHKQEGEPCRSCGTPLKKRVPKKKKIKPHQTYYFEWHLYCPGCSKTYMVEEAKRFVEKDGLPEKEPDSCESLF